MALIEAGRGVLAARSSHPSQSLADLYDPDYMPADLRAAHRELDKVADLAFGAERWLKDDDDARLKILFDSYARMTGERD
ncbi:type IIL restriction-modification enzyme MmeI [Bifidobacterium longum]|uniref:type IIL restriction-modification enzyme MmeI n=1 Tax=Bifidobacterium longum TaxID=216816 RepID=UPI002E29C9C4|nr:type IIL restriction-modification enzyme MmeI [Bifidobacterium longum]